MRTGTVTPFTLFPITNKCLMQVLNVSNVGTNSSIFTLNVRQSVLPLSLNAYSTPCSFRPPEHGSHKAVKAQEEGRSGGERISNFQALDYIKKTIKQDHGK